MAIDLHLYKCVCVNVCERERGGQCGWNTLRKREDGRRYCWRSHEGSDHTEFIEYCEDSGFYFECGGATGGF